MKDLWKACIVFKAYKTQIQLKQIFHQSMELKVQNNLRYFSVLTRTGIDDYEKERLTHKIFVPKKFNFARDVLDQWAFKEKNGIRTTSIPAFWYVYEDGKEYKLSFQELERQSKRMARLLEHKCGIKRGDNVIIMLPKIPEYWLINIAAMRIGFVLSPSAMMLTSKDLAYRFSSFKPAFVIAHESVADIVDEADKICPNVTGKILVSSSPCRKNGWIDLNHLQPDSENHICAETDEDETLFVYFTSGTTGDPKMVEHTHSSQGLGFSAYGRYCLDLSSKNILWNLSDTGWSKTQLAAIFGSWYQGACVFVHQMNRFSPKTTLEVFSKYPIDTFCAPPLVYRTILMENLDLSKLKHVEHFSSVGEPLTPEVIKQWIAATGTKIYECYGQTETRILTGMMKSFEYRIGSIGKPVPGIDLRILDENENELEPGKVGEIAVKRKTLQVNIFKGYKNNPQFTKKFLTENYFHTGDMGYYDEDGYYWFVGRNDDLINSAGYRIGPHEVESALMSHPAVAEVAVVSSPDPKRGEVVKAFVSLRNGLTGTHALIKELQEHCKAVTAPYKYPRKIEFVDEFPKIINGKIKRSELKRKEWSNIKR